MSQQHNDEVTLLAALDELGRVLDAVEVSP